MAWIVIEALVSLGLGIAIVWWTMSPARKREREDERRKASNRAANNGGNDVRTERDDD